MKPLFLFVFALCLSILPLRAMGLSGSINSDGSIEGLFLVKGNQPFLQSAQTGAVFALQLSNPELKVDLQKLHSGDLIAGTGHVIEAQKVAVLDTIDTVGLKQLIGTWKARSGEVINFKNFQLLSVYLPNFKSQTRVASVRTLNYTLTPPDDHKPNRWSILMADSQGVILGSLEIGASAILLKLYDPNTGSQTGQLDLKPSR